VDICLRSLITLIVSMGNDNAIIKNQNRLDIYFDCCYDKTVTEHM